MTKDLDKDNLARRTLRDFPVQERPRERLQQFGEQALSLTELLAVVIGTGRADAHVLRLAEIVLLNFNGLPALAKATPQELQRVRGIGPAKAGKIKAAVELGRRIMRSQPEERRKITSPEEVANLLMSEMMYLEQEHLRVILLDTRNSVLQTPTIYIGSLNTSVIRVGEIFKPAIRNNAAAIIVAHNHPSGDPSPSPEDIRVTRSIVDAGKLLDIELLDHVIIGHNRYVSLKDQALGFE